MTSTWPAGSSTSPSAGVDGRGAAPPQGPPPPSGGRSLLRRKGVRPALTVLSVLLFLGGIGLLSYPVLTDLYTERFVQRGLEAEYAADSMRQDYASRSLADDDPLTRLVIPAIDVDTLVVAGTTPAALRAGAGHYRDTPLPGEEGNVGIAAHRTTYGKPLRHADELDVGTEIRLETPLGIHTYEVIPAPEGAQTPCDNGACWITTPHDWSVVEPMDGHYLTLTTCHPLRSDRQRLIVRAELVDTEELPRSEATG